MFLNSIMRSTRFFTLQFLLKIPIVNDKISDQKFLKISNVLKRPKMRFAAPQAPIFGGGGEGAESY